MLLHAIQVTYLSIDCHYPRLCQNTAQRIHLGSVSCHFEAGTWYRSSDPDHTPAPLEFLPYTDHSEFPPGLRRVSNRPGQMTG